MAELMIKTSDNGLDPQWRDGDTMLAFNNLRIHNVYAEMICRSGNLDKDDGKWIDEALAEMHFATMYQYKTERLSKTEVRVTNQWESKSIIKNGVPNEHGNVMHVDQFFRGRLLSKPHLVFGTPGAEVYYHGRSRYLDAEDTYIWNQIEARTNKRKVDYNSYPKGIEDRFQNLVITVDDFDNATWSDLESAVYDEKADPPVMLKKRKNKVDWRNLPGLTAEMIADVNKPDVEVDIRMDFLFTRSQIIEIKPMVAVV